MTKEALKMALEALEEPKEHFAKHRRLEAITAIKEALAQPEQEPVAWEQFYPDIGKPQIEFAPVKIVAYTTCPNGMVDTCCENYNDCTLSFYDKDAGRWSGKTKNIGSLGMPVNVLVTPPQRTWAGLTQTQVKLLWEGVREEAIKSGDSLNWVFYTHINEALKEKNT